jgi:hypothetical protein
MARVSLEDRVEVHMAYSRQWLADTLRRLGFAQEADDAMRELPDEFDHE